MTARQQFRRFGGHNEVDDFKFYRANRPPAFWRGRDVGLLGGRSTDCPFNRRHSSRIEWLDGWLAGVDESGFLSQPNKAIVKNNGRIR